MGVICVRCQPLSASAAKKELSGNSNMVNFIGPCLIFNHYFRCLVEGRGDVAFISHKTALRMTEGKSDKVWAKELRSIDFKLLCRNQSLYRNTINRNIDDFNTISNPNSVHNNQRFRLSTNLMPLNEYEKCHLAVIPSSVVVTSAVTPEELRFEVLQLVTALSHTFTNVVPQSFQLFGVYRNETNLMFSDNTKKISSLPMETTYAEALGSFLPLLEHNDFLYCANLGHHIKHQNSIVMLILLITFTRSLIMAY